MADASSVTGEAEIQSEQEKLKYLEFVEVAVKQATDYASGVVGYGKDNAGPLKSGIETIESTIMSILAPAIEKVHDVLKFVDDKVEDSVAQLEKVLPTALTEVITTTDVKSGGVVETVKELLVKIDPVAEEYASSAWKTLSQLPLVATVVEAIAPAAVYITEKYNDTVQQTAEEGYKVASFLPLVPTDKIARVFSTSEAEAAAPVEGEVAEEVPGGGEEAAEVPPPPEAAEVPAEGEVVEEQ